MAKQNNLFNLKVFQNKRNNQLSVILPKRFMKEAPKSVEVKLPKNCIKGRGEKWIF